MSYFVTGANIHMERLNVGYQMNEEKTTRNDLMIEMRRRRREKGYERLHSQVLKMRSSRFFATQKIRGRLIEILLCVFVCTESAYILGSITG